MNDAFVEDVALDDGRGTVAGIVVARAGGGGRDRAGAFPRR